ncbi:MAG: DnaB-like helicase C-terminal domain-containing protein [Bacteroidales bacterium]|jgi:archaellum biogenesis ATPase FlaH|nr:DnaB-like helicase C-terminal domain-containing protein [Bacteroidales bacterium]
MLNTQVLCKYPITYLQDKLQGICTGDLVIFGASSGSGKSTISRLLTRGAYEQNCPVVLYSLENSAGTFISEDTRLLYNQETGSKVEQRAWEIMHSKNPELFEKYRRAIFERHQKEFNGIKLLKVHEEITNLNYTVDMLLKSMQEEYNQGYRLFIIDHLDMLISDPRNELAQTVYNMNKLWNFVATNNIGCVAFSQTTDLPENVLCPNDTLLRGSRTKGQRATVVITLAQHKYGYYELPDDKFAKPTYMRIAKFRQGSTSCAIVYYKDSKYINYYNEVLCDYTGRLIDGMTVDKFIKDINKGK